MTIISTTVGKNPLEEWRGHHSQQKSLEFSTWVQSQKLQNDLCSFPRQTTQYHSNPWYYSRILLTDYSSTSNAEEAEQFYEEL